MTLFPVYPLMPISPISGEGSWLIDEKGDKYLDLYGGHAVISIGHSHPYYVNAIKNQVDQMVFYSNSVQNPLQEKLADLLGELSGLEDYQLFLCNSGAEANENALKVASFVTGKDKILALRNGFHGRTSGAVAVTDNAKITSPFNKHHQVHFIDINDKDAAIKELETGAYAAIIVEPIQGVAGIYELTSDFLISVEKACKENNTLLIIDEVQSGYGRSGKFFAYQYTDIKPDIITMAKGMGNGFPIGGVLISPDIKAESGMLGTTFGGNHLACAAGIAVLEVIKKEKLIENSDRIGKEVIEKLKKIDGIKNVRGKGLMIGFDFDFPVNNLRTRLATRKHILIGSASNSHTLRLLPALNVKPEDLELFYNALIQELKEENVKK